VWQTLEEKKLEGADDKKNKKFNKYVKSNDKGKADPKGTPGQLRYRIEESEKLELQCVRAENHTQKGKKMQTYCKIFWNDHKLEGTTQTKHISGADSVEWKEGATFMLPLEKLTMELFDANTLTSNTFHGQVDVFADAFSMFPTRAGDFDPQAYPLHNKSGSNKEAQGELVLDMQYMRRMQVHIVNAAGLAKADTFGKSDPFVRVFWKTMEEEEYVEVHKTKVHSKNLEPVFDETCDVWLPQREKDVEACRLKFEVYDKDLIGKNMLGELELGVFEQGYKVHKLQKKAGSGGQDVQKGFLGIRLAIEDGDLGVA